MTDYGRAKVAALQQLAAGGDAGAERELARRGVDVTTAVDVRTLDGPELRRLVSRWRDGMTPDERRRNRAIAEQAYAELMARFLVDLKLFEMRRLPNPPVQVLTPPWEKPRQPRCVGWQRPKGSTLYPSEADRLRAVIAQQAREHWTHTAAGAPRQE